MSDNLKMYINGRIVAYEDCKIHAFANVVKYGTGLFEGIRGYWNEKDEQLYIFKLDEHIERLMFGMKALQFEHSLTKKELADSIIEVSRANNIRANTHYRILAFIEGDEELNGTGPVGIVTGAVERAPSPILETGIGVMVSSWRRLSDDVMPPRVKCIANYVNNRAADLEAKAAGYQGALMLNNAGKISEGTGACVFMLRKGRLVTPGVTSDILESITRDTLIEIAAARFGMEVEQRPVDRSELLDAEEVFWCGSRHEVVPITSLHRVPIGEGKPGPFTRNLQKAYFDIAYGYAAQDYAQWRTPVW
jgi:branched-chain amino acid aminotransferase